MTRRRKPRVPAAPLAPPDGPTAELLAHLETVEIPPDLAGAPPTRKRAPAHRRLARTGRIPPEVETEVELFAIAWEMVEGGATEEGSGGDARRTRAEVYTAATMRLQRARQRLGPLGTAVVVQTCVVCLPAWEVAHYTLGYPLPAGVPPVPAEAKRALEWLDRRLPAYLHRLAGIPLAPESRRA